MNDASTIRVKRARRLAEIYAAHPDVGAIILGGSAARHAAHGHSDIDLGVFWTAIPSQETRHDLLQCAGGRLHRWVDNRLRYSVDNPRREGLIEIATLEATVDMPQLGLDVEHETIAGTREVLGQVIEQGDLSLEKQELLSVIQAGTVLYGHAVADAWRVKAQSYPDDVVSRMVEQYCVGVGEYLLGQVRWTETQDWFCFYEGLLSVGRRLSLALMGLNRVWVFTDNPDLKGLRSVAEDFVWQPERFVDRLGRALQSSAPLAIRRFADLSEEVFDLVEARLPTMDLTADRESLGHIGHNLEDSASTA